MLDMDIPTSRGLHLLYFVILALNCSTEPGSKKQTSSGEIWQAVDSMIRFLTQLFKTMSQLALIVHISRSAGGPIFALMCIARPMFSALYARGLWDKSKYDML